MKNKTFPRLWGETVIFLQNYYLQKVWRRIDVGMIRWVFSRFYVEWLYNNFKKNLTNYYFLYNGNGDDWPNPVHRLHSYITHGQ